MNTIYYVVGYYVSDGIFTNKKEKWERHETIRDLFLAIRKVIEKGHYNFFDIDVYDSRQYPKWGWDDGYVRATRRRTIATYKRIADYATSIKRLGAYYSDDRRRTLAPTLKSRAFKTFGR
jgi:hypothetical protein